MVPVTLSNREYVLLALGIAFAAAATFRPSVTGEIALNFVSALWLLAACAFVVFGRQLRGTSVFILAVLASAYLVLSFSTNIWADRVTSLTGFPDTAPARESANLGSVTWFVFDCAIVLSAVGVATMLVFHKSNHGAAT